MGHLFEKEGWTEQTSKGEDRHSHEPSLQIIISPVLFFLL